MRLQLVVRWPTKIVNGLPVRVFCAHAQTVDDPRHQPDRELYALWRDYVCTCGSHLDTNACARPAF